MYKEVTNMTGGYPEIKHLWQNLFVAGLESMDIDFDGASYRDLLLIHLAEFTNLPPSILEIGPMYNPWAKSIVEMGVITRVHLSDSIYATRGIPKPTQMNISPEIFSADDFGLPELLTHLPNLGLRRTILILASVLNYVNKDDVIALLKSIGNIYSPEVVVIGNMSDAVFGYEHVNRICNPQDMSELMITQNFRPMFEKINTKIIAGIYQKNEVVHPEVATDKSQRLSKITNKLI